MFFGGKSVVVVEVFSNDSLFGVATESDAFSNASVRTPSEAAFSNVSVFNCLKWQH